MKKKKKAVQKKKSNKGIIIGIIILLLIVIGVLSYFLFFGDKVTINTDGGNIVQNMEIKDGEIVTLPVIEKEGYKVVAYVNENKQIVKKGSKVSKKTKLTPVYAKEDEELIRIEFYDGNQKLEEISLPKGVELITPEDPAKEGMTFGGWKLENGNILIGNPIVENNLKFIAIWISNEKEMITVTIVSDNETVLGKYKQEKGTKIKLPSSTKKEGLVFEGWKDSDGNVITSDTILEKDIIIHAYFAKYNCPENCNVNDDGVTCTKTETKNKETKTVCPDGAFMYYNNCITLKGAGDARIRQCAAGKEFGNKEVYYGDYCAKVVKKVTKKVCPSGYKENGDKCKKETIVKCTKE